MINLVCLVIFLTYLAICFYLGYMFLKDRKIFNIVIIDSIASDFNHLRNLCFGIDDLENDPDPDTDMENNKKQIEILSGIYKIFKTINKNNIPDSNLFLAEYEMFKWMLECIIRDYQHISTLPGNYYYQMEKTYLANQNNNNDSNNNNKIVNSGNYDDGLGNRSLGEHDPDILNYLANETQTLLSMFKYIQEQKTTIREFQSIFLITLFQNIEKYIIDLFETYPELFNGN